MGVGSKTLYVWRNIQLMKGRLMVFGALFLFATILFALNEYLFSSIGLIILPLSYILGAYTYRSYLIWISGLEGEQMVIESLSRINDDYIMLNGLVVPPNRGDIDHIIVGPNGIFVVESKNYGGIISCDGDIWKKERMITPKNTVSTKIGSPSNQIKRNAKVLKDFILTNQKEIFKGYAPHLWVHGVVVFTNSNATLKLANPTVEIVGIGDIGNHIISTKSDYSLSEEQIEKIGLLLSKHCS